MPKDYKELFNENPKLALAISEDVHKLVEDYYSGLIYLKMAGKPTDEQKTSKNLKKDLIAIIEKEVNSLFSRNGLPNIDVNNDEELKSFIKGYRNYFFEKRTR